MRIDRAINYDDLERLAKRRLAKIAFDFIEGGVEGETGLDWNVDAFKRQRLVPRYLVDASKPILATKLFGRTHAAPFGIAPTGAISMFRPGGDVMLARAAKAADIPFVISGASTATLEAIAAAAPDHAWFQLYHGRDRRIADDLVMRAKNAGVSTLVVTVDTPGPIKRERNLRNGFLAMRKVRPPLRIKLDALLHPMWLYDYVTGPGMTASNFEKYAAEAGTRDVLAFLGTQLPNPVLWDDIARLRKLWTGPLVIKGIMHHADAREAVKHGVDGIIVSNHGGRQLDRSPAPFEVLPRIVHEVGDKVTVMMDSGIRRGSDIVAAMCAGAKFCFVGRWTLYGVAAGGEPGATHAVQMIRDEVAKTMTQIGAPDVGGLNRDWLFDAGQ